MVLESLLFCVFHFRTTKIAYERLPLVNDEHIVLLVWITSPTSPSRMLTTLDPSRIILIQLYSVGLGLGSVNLCQRSLFTDQRFWLHEPGPDSESRRTCHPRSVGYCPVRINSHGKGKLCQRDGTFSIICICILWRNAPP